MPYGIKRMNFGANLVCQRFLLICSEVLYTFVAKMLQEIIAENMNMLILQSLQKLINLLHKNGRNLKIDTFLFLAMSLALIELWRCGIPHLNHLNKTNGPLVH